MNPSSKAEYLLKALAVVAIAQSLFWLSIAVRPWLSIFSSSQPLVMKIFGIAISLWFSIPAIPTLYFGWRAMRRNDPATIKGLVAACCVPLAFVLAAYLHMPGVPAPEQEIPVMLPLLCSTIISIAVYLFVSRRFLSALGHPCPPLRQSLPPLPIFLVALFLWQALMAIGGPAGHAWLRANRDMPVLHFAIATLFLIMPILLSVGAYRLGIWLFVRQKNPRHFKIQPAAHEPAP